VYNQYHLPTACDISNNVINVEDDSLLMMRDPINLSEFQVIMRVGEQIGKEEQVSLEKLIAMCDRIVCIELSQELESKIEKLYLSFVPELYTRYSEFRPSPPSLTFINATYPKSYSRDA
jgi:hypothetical protein